MRNGVLGLVVCGLLLTACGGSDEAAGPSATGTPDTPGPTAGVSTTPAAPPPGASPAAGSGDATPGGTRLAVPEPTPVGDTSADGLWGRAAEVVCADVARQGRPPADRAEAATWLRDRAWATVDKLEAVAGNGPQGKELRDIMYAVGTQSSVLADVYRTGQGDAAALIRVRAESTARLGRYAAVLKAPSCAALVRVG